MTDPSTLTKLIILYMLDQVDFPLKKSQIFDFVLVKEYSKFFDLNIAANELIDLKYIEASSTHSTTFLSITEEGRNTLNLLKSKMSEGIRKDILDYFRDNKIEIANEVSIMSNYYLTSNGDYVAELAAREKGNDLVNIKLYMPTEESSKAICDKWRKKNQDIYAYLLENLL